VANKAITTIRVINYLGSSATILSTRILGIGIGHGIGNGLVPSVIDTDIEGPVCPASAKFYLKLQLDISQKLCIV
jgi:hypothetical protein